MHIAFTLIGYKWILSQFWEKHVYNLMDLLAWLMTSGKLERTHDGRHELRADPVDRLKTVATNPWALGPSRHPRVVMEQADSTCKHRLKLD